jgi:F-type H+-transporting ATPase subunit b
MQIDWTTFALEIVNFLALVWILKRFLYRPVLDTLAQRRAGVEHTLAQARETEERAAALKVQFESRLADWEKEKAAARTRFEGEMAAERARQMQALTKSLAEERARNEAQEAHRQEELRRELEEQALAQGRAFAAALLSRLAGPDMERLLVELFAEDFSSLPEDRLAGLRAAAEAPGARATVASAFPLAEAQRRRIGEVIAGRLGLAIPLEFSEDATLLAGLRVSVGPWQLKAGLADELAFFAAASNHAD